MSFGRAWPNCPRGQLTLQAPIPGDIEEWLRRNLEARQLPVREINELMEEWRSQRRIAHWEADHGDSTGDTPGGRYWLTTPEIYAALKQKCGPFDFDLCHSPRPEGYDSLVIRWGARNFVSPPFHQQDGVNDQGPIAFVRK